MNLIQFLTGLLVAGESIILYFVMKYKSSPWLTPMNRAYVVIDIITGLTLLASGLKWIPVQRIILLTSALIHIYRDYEAYRGMENRYAFNTPLLVVLNIRLLALFYVIQNN
ncbi:hypothetical protein GF326_02985 [Candidatus Bathyarchaeota archaeon]|nr:hypothetical protein [Candidatus Bathyarchaeota archaeon]